MTTIYVKSDSDVAREAVLPRDLSNVSSVDVHIDNGETTQTEPAIIMDEATDTVGIQMENFTLVEDELYRFEFELTYTDGSVETIPRDDYDYLKVTADLD